MFKLKQIFCKHKWFVYQRRQIEAYLVCKNCNKVKWVGNYKEVDKYLAKNKK